MTEAQRLAARIETENYEAASMIWRLEAEGSSLCEQNSMLDAKLAELEAECEALRKDAERYRWMKREVKRIPPGWELIGWDEAIDAAMGKEIGND
jgi:predicted RNase H-like nuclease (RuvC/YqgF family)